MPVSAAPSADSGQQGDIQAASEPNQRASAPDDPEIELYDGVKLKKSELGDLHKRRKELDRGAFEKFQKSSQMDKESRARIAQAEQLISGLSKDYKSALRQAGHDPIKVAEQILQEALSEYQLTPEQKELRELKAEKARREEEDAEKQKQDDAAKEHAAVSQWEQRFDQAFTQAIQTSGLPKTARVVARMAEKVESYWGAGYEVPLEEIAAEIKQDLIAERRELLQSMKDEQLGELYDDDELEKARKLLVRKAQAQQSKPQVQQSSSALKKPKNGLTRAELDARISQRIGAK